MFSAPKSAPLPRKLYGHSEQQSSDHRKRPSEQRSLSRAKSVKSVKNAAKYPFVKRQPLFAKQKDSSEYNGGFESPVTCAATQQRQPTAQCITDYRLDSSGEHSEPLSSPTDSMDSKKSRRKSSSSPASTALKSPALAIKRSETAPVTLQGWLYKQGSDGLQLWKKRWFVLSEFCLFYYKGPDEDKQLGSILLPSYSISPLSKEDGVYRKYAFKAEHANMRTYYFGAETKDSMIQWMNSLSLASILQNENNLRPEILARQLARQGNYPPQMRHFPPPHRTLAPPHQMQQYQQQYLQNQLHHQQDQVYALQQLQQAPPPEGGGGGEGRQPLYANAPPKPRRLNTSRDYSPSPDNSPERWRPNQVESEDPSFPRHRLPQERRTPEAYGRSNPRFSRDREDGPLEYEDVYNDRNYNEEIVRYAREAQNDRRLSTDSYAKNNQQQHPAESQFSRPRSEHFPANHGLPVHQQVGGGHHDPGQDKVPRPHSADFLEFERNHPRMPGTLDGGPTRPSEVKRPGQPPRPKSSIGEIRKPDDFWSEEVYAQKMRESAFAYDPSAGGSRSQSRAGSRPPMQRSSTLQNFGENNVVVPNLNLGSPGGAAGENFHPLQLSPARNPSQLDPQTIGFPSQLPPPAFYQDNSPRDPRHQPPYQETSPRHQPPYQETSPRHQPPYTTQTIYSPNQSFASSTKSAVLRQNTSYMEDQLQQQQQHHMYKDVSGSTSSTPRSTSQNRHINHSHVHSSQEGQQQQLVQHQHLHNMQDMQHSGPTTTTSNHPHLHNLQEIHQPQHDPRLQPQYYPDGSGGTAVQMSPSSRPAPNQDVNNSTLSSSISRTSVSEVSNLGCMDNDPKITMPPSFPLPTPRKISNHTPTMYQNIPANAKARSDPRPVSTGRLETATPNRFSERFDSDRSQDSQGDFRRSASARLPKQKGRPGDFNANLHEESDDSKKTSDQREESMKRLLDWKQRMLQSPLTRKSSRNTSRTQTPTNSDSPVPSLHNDDIRKRVIEELALHEISTPNQECSGGKERKLSRKGSSGSRSSRSRSSPRIAPSKNSLYSSDDEDVPRPESRQRRRSLSSGRRSSDLETLKKKLGGSLSNMTAGDLLGKSQEELVLILIQLRRQAATLQETVDACKAELDNMRNTREQGGEDLRQHTWELEEQLARMHPVINLVDNMVKLGTLYRTNNNNTNVNINNIEDKKNGNFVNNETNPRTKLQDTIEERMSRRQVDEEDDNSVSFPDDQANLEKELQHVQSQLQTGLKKLEESGSHLAKFERDIFTLRQQLRASVERDRERGRERTSQETLEIEGHLRVVQGRAMDLERRRGEIVNYINQLRGKESLLSKEIRPSPTGVSGAEPVPSKKRVLDTWMETDIDNNRTRDRGPDTLNQLDMEKKANLQSQESSDRPVYINTFEDTEHKYENLADEHNYANYRAELECNPYEDDVQTVHSEGVRSEYDHPPPIPDRPAAGGENGETEVILGLGELSEADERVQRYYGIIPKDKPMEIKTVRMVKRDHKERLSKGRRGDEDSESVELSLDEDEPPPPLPRGNYQNLHTFLSNQPYENNNHRVSIVTDEEKKNSVKPQFKIGEYIRRQDTTSGGGGSSSRPGSSLSAHERLFGVCRDDSISPDMSPAKSSLASSDSTTSALMSPVFKSAAARAIIEEERKTPMIIPKAKKKNKKRHMTITSSHPAVLEAINKHEKLEANRSLDDLDMERILKPRDAPDVVRSTYGQENDLRENSIDNLFGAPQKIKIPERYVPDKERDESTPEERQTRLKKADSIRRMLADTSIPVVQKREGEQGEEKKARHEREQLLALNQVLARQVMEKSRMVAGQLPES